MMPFIGMTNMKTFEVERMTGCKYQGVVFDDGVTVIHWITKPCPSTTIFPDFEAFESVYLQPGKNKSVIFNGV